MMTGTRMGNVLAAGLVALLAVKAWLDFDPSWDSWYYHLPFAGRLWGITPLSMYEMEPGPENYYRGHPLLGEWMQGFFWWVSGRAQAANLFSVLCFGAFLWAARRFFGVSAGVLAVALLAVPLVHIHVTSCYVDLPGNLAVSLMLLGVWRLTDCDAKERLRLLGLIAVCGMVAANIKLQMMPPVLACYGMAAFVCLRQAEARAQLKAYSLTAWAMVVLVMAVTFYIEWRNLLLFGRPFYPFRVSFFPLEENNIYTATHYTISYLHRGLPALSWFGSVLEVGRHFGDWRIDQLQVPAGGPHDRAGGYFAAYVLAQLGFFFYASRGQRAARWLMLASTVLAAMMPQAYELRYYQFWMITLVCLNVLLLKPGRARVAYIGVAVLCFGVVTAALRGEYLLPQGIMLEEVPRYIHQRSPFPFVADKLDTEFLAQIPEGGEVMIYNRLPSTFLYASYWHPPRQYRVIARYIPRFRRQ